MSVSVFCCIAFLFSSSSSSWPCVPLFCSFCGLFWLISFAFRKWNYSPCLCPWPPSSFSHINGEGLLKFSGTKQGDLPLFWRPSNGFPFPDNTRIRTVIWETLLSCHLFPSANLLTAFQLRRLPPKAFLCRSLFISLSLCRYRFLLVPPPFLTLLLSVSKALCQLSRVSDKREHSTLKKMKAMQFPLEHWNRDHIVRWR